MIHRTSLRSTFAEAVNDLVTASKVDHRDDRVVRLLHDVARQCRSDDSATFDSTWIASGETLPEWLTLDVGHIDLVIQWIENPSYTVQAAFSMEHSAALLDGATDIALSELALGTEHGGYLANCRAIVNAARQHGFAAVHESLVARERKMADESTAERAT